jgi:succinate dehydrogenase/fumarate reductase cytochrome b subunit
MLSSNKTISRFIFFLALAFHLSNGMLRILIEKRKTDHSAKNKTHKTLTRKILFGITLPVAKVTVFETSEGTGEQSGDTLGESKHRAVCGYYDARR